MDTDRPNTDLAADARARCAAYGLFAHGYRYPDGDWLAALVDERRWGDWPGRIASLYRDAEAPLAALQHAVSDLRAHPTTDALQEHYALLFGHAVRGTCPPYELEYGTSEVIQRASDLADVAGFYAAFGMTLDGPASERPDHVSVESEFMAVLCAKQTYGLEHDRPALVTVAEQAQRTFLDAHLGGWLPALAQRIQTSMPDGFYADLSRFAVALLTGECRRLGVTIGSAYLELRPVDAADESTQSCGVPATCGGAAAENLTQLNVDVRKGG